MKLSDFDFDLPEDLIATRPARPRTHARLLLADVGQQLTAQSHHQRERNQHGRQHRQNFHSFCYVGIENVFLGYIVAFLSNLLLGSYDFILNLESSEAKLAELLREIMWWNFDHTELGSLLLFRCWREFKLTGN